MPSPAATAVAAASAQRGLPMQRLLLYRSTAASVQLQQRSSFHAQLQQPLRQQQQQPKHDDAVAADTTQKSKVWKKLSNVFKRQRQLWPEENAAEPAAQTNVEKEASSPSAQIISKSEQTPALELSEYPIDPTWMMQYEIALGAERIEDCIRLLQELFQDEKKHVLVEHLPIPTGTNDHNHIIISLPREQEYELVIRTANLILKGAAGDDAAQQHKTQRTGSVLMLHVLLHFCEACKDAHAQAASLDPEHEEARLLDGRIFSQLVVACIKQRHVQEAFDIINHVFERVNSIIVDDASGASRLKKLSFFVSRQAYEKLIAKLCDLGRLNEALALYNQMRSCGHVPTEYPFIRLLPLLAAQKRQVEVLQLLMDAKLVAAEEAAENPEQLHRPAEPFNIAKICGTVINGYVDSGNIILAEQFLDVITEFTQDVSMHSYNKLMLGFARAQKFEQLERFMHEKLATAGKQLDEYSINILVTYYAKADRINEANAYLERMLRMGMQPLPAIYSALIASFIRTKREDLIPSLLQHVKEHKMFTIQVVNSLMIAFINAEKGQRAGLQKAERVLVTAMNEDGISMDIETYTIILGAMFDIASVELSTLKAHAKRQAYLVDVEKQIEGVQARIEEEDLEVNAAFYRTLIRGYVQLGLYDKAIDLLRTITQSADLPIDVHMFDTGIKELLSRDEPELAENVLQLLEDESTAAVLRPEADTYHQFAAYQTRKGNTSVSSNKTRMLKELLARMKQRDIVPNAKTLNQLVLSLQMEQRDDEAEEMLINELFNNKDVAPTDGTFQLLLRSRRFKLMKSVPKARWITLVEPYANLCAEVLQMRHDSGITTPLPFFFLCQMAGDIMHLTHSEDPEEHHATYLMEKVQLLARIAQPEHKIDAVNAFAYRLVAHNHFGMAQMLLEEARKRSILPNQMSEDLLREIARKQEQKQAARQKSKQQHK